MKKYIYKLALYPVKLYWFLFRPNGYGVKCIIKRNDGKILLIRNTYGSGSWNLPGGGVKKGESAEQAVRREVKEETGIILNTLQPIGAFLSTLEYKKDHINVFLAHTNSEIGEIDPGEISEAKWFSSGEFPQSLATVARQSLALLASTNPNQ